MSEDTKSKMTKMAKGALPWEKGVAWWVVLIEGIVLTGLGLYMFFAQAQTYLALAWVIALILTVSGLLNLYAAIGAGKSQNKQWAMIHALVGLITGLIIIVFLLFSLFLDEVGMTILGLGCLVYGGLGVYLTFNKTLASHRWLALLLPIFFVVIGALLLLQAIGVGTLAQTIQVINLIILLAGIVLLIWAFILRRESSSAK